MKQLEEICDDARKVSNTDKSYRCVSEDPCKLKSNVFGIYYCIYPLDPEKYAKDLPKTIPEDHYLKYFKFGEGI